MNENVYINGLNLEKCHIRLCDKYRSQSGEQMKKILCAILALFIVGCAHPHKPMPLVHHDISVVKLKFVEDVHESCNEGAGTSYPRLIAKYQSCARWTASKTFKSTGRQYNTCEITLGKNVNMEVLGHEVLHCFTGNFHGGESHRDDLAAR